MLAVTSSLGDIGMFLSDKHTCAFASLYPYIIYKHKKAGK